MFSLLRNRFGIPGVIALLALVFAMIGGAYAASGGLTKQQKKQVKKIAKTEAKKLVGTGPAGPAGPAGAPGAAGAQGPQGVTGPEGPEGAAGAAGAAGADGKTVLSGTTVPSAGLGTNGDFYIRTSTSEIYGPKAGGVWGSPTSLKGADGAAGPAGPEGSPWVAGEAPSGVILKGTWAIQDYSAAEAGEDIPVPISSGVPVPSGLPEGSGGVFRFAIGAGLENGEQEETAEALCPGSAANPTVSKEFAELIDEGLLCIYAHEQTNLNPPAGPVSEADFLFPNSGGGVVAMFHSAAAGKATGLGSWVMYTP